MKRISNGLLALVLLAALSVSCDSLYQYIVLGDFPQQDKFKVDIKIKKENGNWLLSKEEIKHIGQREFSGLCKIIEKRNIGPGVVKLNIEKVFTDEIEEIKIIRLSDGKESVLRTQDIEIYKETERKVIIYIRVK